VTVTADRADEALFEHLQCGAFDYFLRANDQSDSTRARGYRSCYFHFLDIESGTGVWRSEVSLIATGSRSLRPTITGLNDTLFDLTVLPKSLLVIGGGPVGCQVAPAMCFGRDRPSAPTVPRCTCTDPEIAHVVSVCAAGAQARHPGEERHGADARRRAGDMINELSRAMLAGLPAEGHADRGSPLASEQRKPRQFAKLSESVMPPPPKVLPCPTVRPIPLPTN